MHRPGAFARQEATRQPLDHENGVDCVSGFAVHRPQNSLFTWVSVTLGPLVWLSVYKGALLLLQ